MSVSQSMVVRRGLRQVRPCTPNELHAYLDVVIGFTMPRTPRVRGNTAPFDYLEHSYFESETPRDCIVWANRGGGKTQLGAIATLLDMLFKPGIEIRILGGSFDQSSRMYRYLRALFESDLYSDLVVKITATRLELVNGSSVEVLKQSERAVRGHRVHKLRCDELELFDPAVWEAAQLITRSGQCGPVHVKGAVEALSTMHRPGGLMQCVVQDDPEQVRRRVFRWNVIDVLEQCPPSRACESCNLFDSCRGAARRGIGHVFIEDALQQQQRIGRSVWDSEMLCRRPNRTHAVYPQFEREVHVRVDMPVDQIRARDWPVARDVTAGMWLGGMDFGYRSPTVLLWAQVQPGGVLHIVDELIVRLRTSEQVIELAHGRSWPVPSWIGADPAGRQRNEHTGVSTISLWKQAGWAIRTRRVDLASSIAAVHQRLGRADGAVGLYIHPRCVELIRSLETYHYPATAGERSVPVKDGADHAADALRYLIANLDWQGVRARAGRY